MKIIYEKKKVLDSVIVREVQIDKDGKRKVLRDIPCRDEEEADEYIEIWEDDREEDLGDISGVKKLTAMFNDFNEIFSQPNRLPIINPIRL